MIEPQVDGIPVVHQNFVDANAVAETRVQRQWRLIRNDGTVAGGRRVNVVQAHSRIATTATGSGARAARADRAAAERGRVPGKAATAAAAARDIAAAAAVGATGAAAAGAVAAAPATGAVPAALDPRYAFQVRGVSVMRTAVGVTRPHRPRYAVLMHVDDALLDGRQQPWRRPLHRTARRSVRRRWRRPVPQTLGGRRRTLVQARVVRVRLAVVPGTAALILPRLIVVVVHDLVVHVNRIYSVTPST